MNSEKPVNQQSTSQKKQYGFVYTTVPNIKEAQHISQICIHQKWAACANIYPSMVSVYNWKGKVKEEQEVVLLLKTRKDLFKDLCDTLTKNHSYECPCIVFIPFSEGYNPFFSWMDSQLQKTKIK